MDEPGISPRGAKRTAQEAFHAPHRIKALHQDVVNKIAAGEIIIAPVHALKELIENAVDAGSTSIEVLIKEGGLKLLQITDNGSGINRDDLAILCERHTTSKLKTFEDLTSIGTYGFRGEALASISHIAHLTVTTKTPESSCAYKAFYATGRLAAQKPGQSAEPKPCAGRQGTQIQVEDLFYNVPSRKRAFRSASEEYAKILDMVGRYSVHCKGVAFSCKKHGEAGTSLAIPAHADVLDRIRLIHNAAIANELISFNVSNEKLGFRAEGWASSANYVGKKTTFLLFINHRSVESSNIRKAVETTYSSFLPRHGRPFIYLSLDIDPARVDVNVHPTKREVNFLDEDEITELICEDIQQNLSKVDTSRTFMTQSLLSTKRPTQSMLIDDSALQSTSEPVDSHEVQGRSAPKTQKPYENALVRTDSRARKITSMLPQIRSSSPSKTLQPPSITYTTVERDPVQCRLTSIKNLRAIVRDDMHNDLTTLVSQHTFVGVVSPRRRIAAVQSGIKLLLIDYGHMSSEYFYQLGLTDFGNFGRLVLQDPLDFREVLRIGVDQAAAATTDNGAGVDWPAALERVATQLIDRREMLAEYFSLDIDDNGKLTALPLLIKGYMPPLQKLPLFLLGLGPKVNWTDEQECFRTFLIQLANWYVPEVMWDEDGKGEGKGQGEREREREREREVAERRAHVLFAIEHVLFPAFKSRLIATRGLKRGIVEIADLKGLYRVFERC